MRHWDQKTVASSMVQNACGDSAISQTEASDESHYDVFLSYSGLDEQDAHRLFEQMETDGFKVYFAKKSLQAGDSFSEEIRQALIRSSELWVLITPNSLTSEWVTTKWGAGWALEKRIVPILLRCEKQQLPDRLRALQCIDYHDYRRALEHTFEEDSPHGVSVPWGGSTVRLTHHRPNRRNSLDRSCWWVSLCSTHPTPAPTLPSQPQSAHLHRVTACFALTFPETRTLT